MRQDKRMMKKMMKKAKTETLEDAFEVIIRLKNGEEIVIPTPQVVHVRMGPQEIFQIAGTSTKRKSTPIPSELESEEEATSPPEEEELMIPEEDVELVAQRAGVSREEARAALEEAGGEPAKAIMLLSSFR